MLLILLITTAFSSYPNEDSLRGRFETNSNRRSSPYSSPYSRSRTKSSSKNFGDYERSGYREIFDDPYGKTAEGNSRYRSSSPRYSSSPSYSSSVVGEISSDVSSKYRNNPNSAAYEGGGRGSRSSRTSHNDYYSRGPSSFSSRGGRGGREDSSSEYRVGPPQLYNSKYQIGREEKERVKEREERDERAARTRSWGENTTPMNRFKRTNEFPVPGTPPRSNPFA